MFSIRSSIRSTTARAMSIAALSLTLVPAAHAAVTLIELGRHAHGTYDQSGAEIAAYDAASRRLFVVNGNTLNPTVDVLDVANPAAPVLFAQIQVGALYGGAANSVAAKNGVIAMAVENGANKQLPGKAVFIDAATLGLLGQVPVGAIPDMITFTPDGSAALVANEAEPNTGYTSDPEGSVSYIDLTGGIGAATVTTIGFTDFNVGGPRHGELPADVRIYGPGSTVAQDLEPESIAIAPDGVKAWVSLQEANAFAILDLPSRSIDAIVSLGFKNHNLPGNGLDPSDRDNANLIGNWPVFGMYQPDGVAAFTVAGQSYVVAANEGDTRSYTALDEEARVSTLALDPVAFPNAATLKQNTALGRLTVTNKTGDTDGDGDFDALYVPGGRSFSIHDATGARVWDSGDFIETQTALLYPANFNASNTNNTRDDRSDNKGPEPEGVTVAELGGRVYAFLGLERMGGVMVFDVTNPLAPTYESMVNPRNFAQAPGLGSGGDLGPEGVLFIPAADSPTGQPLLVVTNEISGTTTIFGIDSPTPVLPFVDEVAVDGGVARIVWRVEGVAGSVTVWRRAGSEVEWSSRGTFGVDRSGRLEFTDADIVAGGTYAYRLGFGAGGTASFAGETSVTIPGEGTAAAAFALGAASPNPSVGAFTVSFTLPGDGAARLELVSLSGRRIATREVGSLGAGRHAVSLGAERRPAPGVYLVRLVRGDEVRTTKVTIAG